jgi:hypothetical protein
LLPIWDCATGGPDARANSVAAKFADVAIDCGKDSLISQRFLARHRKDAS